MGSKNPSFTVHSWTPDVVNLLGRTFEKYNSVQYSTELLFLYGACQLLHTKFVSLHAVELFHYFALPSWRFPIPPLFRRPLPRHCSQFSSCGRLSWCSWNLLWQSCLWWCWQWLLFESKRVHCCGGASLAEHWAACKRVLATSSKLNSMTKLVKEQAAGLTLYKASVAALDPLNFCDASCAFFLRSFRKKDEPVCSEHLYRYFMDSCLKMRTHVISFFPKDSQIGILLTGIEQKLQCLHHIRLWPDHIRFLQTYLSILFYSNHLCHAAPQWWISSCFSSLYSHSPRLIKWWEMELPKYP